MNALDLLAHLRRASDRPEPAADDHHTATQTRGTPDPTPPATPATPALPGLSAPHGPLHRIPGQAWPSPRTWLTASLTDADT